MALVRSSLLFIVAGIYLGGFPVPSALSDVRVTALDDHIPLPYSGSGDISSEDEICVFNSVNANFQFVVSVAGGVFQLSGSGGTLPFTIEFKPATGGFESLTNGVAKPFTGANTSSNTCGGATNGTIRIKILQGDLLSVRPGSFDAELAITVLPE